MGKFHRIASAVAMAAIVGWLGLCPSKAEAAGMTGQTCDFCHVMHASQGGVATVGGPYGFLLEKNCLGCHSGFDNTAITPVPAVQTLTGVGPLAGGDFRNVTAGNERNGHNPSEIASADITLTSPPGWAPGFAANGQVGGVAYAAASWVPGNGDVLTCSGTFGCHGLHTSAGVNGAHHNNLNSAADGQATGAANDPSKGYRFLNQIKGYEDSAYEFLPTATNGEHNIYYSVARAADTALDAQTISYSCAECHGIFHSNNPAGGADATTGTAGTAFASAWIRHPVDFVMPAGISEYANYGQTGAATWAYRADVPVGSSDVANNVTDVTIPQDRIVMCLSCHRAHASPWPSALRWNPTTTISGAVNTNGCFACHTYKDGNLVNF